MNRNCCDFISKRDAVMLQGFAVSLMVWHHLFGFPDRISVPYFLPLDRIGHLETLLSYFGRICIAMFAFLSGYGIQKKVLSNLNQQKCGLRYTYRTVANHLLKFYSRYWVVFFVFFPIGIILTVYPFNFVHFFKGVLGLTTAYNAEWWYIVSYLRVMLLFPILNLLMDFEEKGGTVIFHIVTLFAILGVVLLCEFSSMDATYVVLLYFLEGMYFVRASLFSKIDKFISVPKMPVGFVLIALVFLLRTKGISDYLLVPFMIMGSVMLFNSKIMVWANRVLSVVGRYSTYVWLTHTFFGYYYFQAFTYFPRYSWLIFTWCMILCLIFGILAEIFLKLIKRRDAESRS